MKTNVTKKKENYIQNNNKHIVPIVSKIKIKATTPDDEKSDRKFDINISLKGLVWRHVLVMEEIFNRFIKGSELDVVNLTENEKLQHHYYYRIQPSVELRDLMKKAIKRIADSNFKENQKTIL